LPSWSPRTRTDNLSVRTNSEKPSCCFVLLRRREVAFSKSHIRK